MPQTIVNGALCRLRVACYTANQVGINVVHYVAGAIVGASQTDLQAAQAYDTVLAPKYKAVLSAQARYRGCSLQVLTPAPPYIPQISVGFDGVGSVAGDMMAGQVSGIISTQTPLAGRKYRGRVYIPFPGEVDNDTTGIPVGGYVTAIDQIATILFNPLTVTTGGNQVTLSPVIFHRATNLYTFISGYISRQKWATQRRRGSYGRTNPTPF
jgi:hypothetical protein